MRKSIAHGMTGWASVISGVVCALLVFAVAASAKAKLPNETDEEWTLHKEADHITVYTIDQPNSSFKAFKAVAVLDAPIENLMGVMTNPGSCVEWVHSCTESYGFGDGSFRDRLVYSVYDMPWPVTDRDYVLRIQTRGNRASGEIVMDMSAVPDQRAESSSRVRVDRSDTLYRFTPQGDKTRMVWLQHTDPDGSLPGWLVNSLLVDIPVRSIKQLERVANLDKYRGYQLVYDENGQLTDVRPPSP